MSQEFPYWIQKADFSAQDYLARDAEGVVRAFESHDWGAELDLRKSLEGRKEEFCPPGMGIVPEDGRILHVCPNGDGTAMVHYHFAAPAKLLWLIPTTKREVKTATAIRIDVIGHMMRLFANSRHDKLMELAV